MNCTNNFLWQNDPALATRNKFDMIRKFSVDFWIVPEGKTLISHNNNGEHNFVYNQARLGY